MRYDIKQARPHGHWQLIVLGTRDKV